MQETPKHDFKRLLESYPADTQELKREIISRGVPDRILRHWLHNPNYRISGAHCAIICEVLECTIHDIYPDATPEMARRLGLVRG